MEFKIGFEKEDLKKLHQNWDEIIESHQWIEVKFTEMSEEGMKRTIEWYKSVNGIK